MNLKIITFLVNFLLLAVIALSQTGMVATTVLAVTSPVTAPVSYFTYYIRGKLTYRLLNILPIPARGITVTAKNLSSNDIFTAKTGINGAYTLEVKQASASALYSVRPATPGAEQIKWIPEEIRKVISKDVTGFDFVGTSITSKTSQTLNKTSRK